MLPENRIPAHPGEILLEEFLKPLKNSQVTFTRRRRFLTAHQRDRAWQARDYP